jgi:hypothetical protein
MFSELNNETLRRIIIKLIVIALLIGCFFFMPGWYYQIVRWVCTIGFLSLSIGYYKCKENWQVALFILGLIIFNPIEQLLLSRFIWNIIDAVYLFATTISIIKDMQIDAEYWLKLQREQIEGSGHS